MRRLRLALVGAVLALVALAAGPPLVSAITATLFVTSSLEPVKVKNDGIRFKTKDTTDVHVQEATFAPGDFVDWHDHPGFALIAVKSGTMTFFQGCVREEVGPGEATVESGGPTKAINEGTTDATFYVTYVVPKGSPRTVPSSPPDCTDDDNGDDDGDDHDD